LKALAESLVRTKKELEIELKKQVASTEHLANQLSILTAEEGSHCHHHSLSIHAIGGMTNFDCDGQVYH
jgi:hypothetical protein